MKLQNLTRSENGPSRRRYEDACGTAHALDLVGERWALLVMRELMLGPKRFSDLRADLPGISANVLTQRLEGLEVAGVLVRRQLAPPASGQVYELTEWGYQAKPVMGALGRWATRSPGHDPSLPLSPVSLMLSFQAMGQPALLKGLEAVIVFQLGRESYTLRIANGAIGAERGVADDPDLGFIGTAAAVAAAVYGGVPLDMLEKEGALKLEGDRDLAARFVTLFPLPPKAEVPG